MVTTIYKRLDPPLTEPKHTVKKTGTAVATV